VIARVAVVACCLMLSSSISRLVANAR
jgi:hypothetical protein